MKFKLLIATTMAVLLSGVASIASANYVPGSGQCIVPGNQTTADVDSWKYKWEPNKCFKRGSLVYFNGVLFRVDAAEYKSNRGPFSVRTNRVMKFIGENKVVNGRNHYIRGINTNIRSWEDVQWNFNNRNYGNKRAWPYSTVAYLNSPEAKGALTQSVVPWKKGLQLVVGRQVSKAGVIFESKVSGYANDIGPFQNTSQFKYVSGVIPRWARYTKVGLAVNPLLAPVITDTDGGTGSYRLSVQFRTPSTGGYATAYVKVKDLRNNVARTYPMNVHLIGGLNKKYTDFSDCSNYEISVTVNGKKDTRYLICQ